MRHCARPDHPPRVPFDLLLPHVPKSLRRFFGSLATAYNATWTRGTPKLFQSSNAVRRAFCGDCGTPLAYETRFGLELVIGAFDDLAVSAPQIQVNLVDKLLFFDRLTSLPIRPEANDEWSAFLAGVHSNQHPDHDTDDWPPQDSK